MTAGQTRNMTGDAAGEITWPAPTCNSMHEKCSPWRAQASFTCMAIIHSTLLGPNTPTLLPGLRPSAWKPADSAATRSATSWYDRNSNDCATPSTVLRWPRHGRVEWRATLVLAAARMKVGQCTRELTALEVVFRLRRKICTGS